MGKKILIVGGVAGGASAAARLRRLDEEAEIILFERDEYISFANCGLPYYLGGVITERENLFVQTPQKMKDDFNIDVRNFSEVTAIDKDNKVVTVNSREKGIYQESYDFLLLAPGAKPIKPPIPGIDHEKILTLRNVADTDRIKNSMQAPGVKHVVVIGGGFIGVEMAENMRHQKLSVTLVEAVPHILAPFDDDMAPYLEKEMEDHGVQLLLCDGVKAFHHKPDNTVELELNSGRRIEADLVILSIGVKPDTDFLRDSGLELGSRGHLIVDEHMKTSDPFIYAVGDAVEIKDFISGQKTALPLAGPANRQGRIAADNIAGLPSSYNGVIGSSIIKVFNLSAAATGANERTLKRQGREYRLAYAHPQSHASYYPGAFPISLKLIFDSNGLILGAQAIGQDGVDKRIDVIAALIKMKGTTNDLTELELCYAPPFGSAKDPLNMLGYIAENELADRFKPLTYSEYQQMEKNDVVTVDVRLPLEFETGHLPHAINIPLGQLRRRMAELPKDKKIVLYCKIGLRSYVAARILTQNAYEAYSISGGFTSITGQSFVPGERAIPVEDNTPNSNAEDLSFKEPQHYDHYFDACGLSCPGPLMRMKSKIDEMKPGEILKISASDPGFFADVASWASATDNELIYREKGKVVTAYIKKSGSTSASVPAAQTAVVSNSEHKTIVVFSNDLDKVIASLIIANGALAMNKKVTIFFTFWGIAALRKQSDPKSDTKNKSLLEKMFGFALPKGAAKLRLSKMNMLGLGSYMMKDLMKTKNVPSVEELLNNAIAGGAELVACQMSMDLMGFRREELIDNISIGGVGYYLGKTDKANMNLFI